MAELIAKYEALGWKLLRWKDRRGNECSGWRSPDGTQCAEPPAEIQAFEAHLITTEKSLTEDDQMHCLAMLNAVNGGGVAPVGSDEAKRLESFGLVKLFPATADDMVPGEILPEYTFTMTDRGEAVAREYRASWKAIR